MGIKGVLALSPAKYIHQFGNLAALISLVAGRNGMFNAVTDMIAQQFVFHPPKRGANGCDLGDHIDAIAILIHHSGQAAYLALDPAEALAN